MSIIRIRQGHFFSRRILFTDENGDAKDLSGASQITMDLFQDPASILATYNTADNAAYFDTADLASGYLTVKLPGDTLDLLGGAASKPVTIAFSVVTATWTDPGLPAEPYLKAIITE